MMPSGKRSLVSGMLVLVIALSAGLLAGCTAASPGQQPSPQVPAPAEAGKPKPGGTFTIEYTTARPSIDTDAHQGTASNSAYTFGQAYLPIIGEDVLARDGKIIGYLADSWTISKDGLTYTFKIKELTTYKGKAFNAEDVAYNINRMITRPNKRPFGRSGCVRELAKGAEAPDKTTVVITLREVSVGFFQCLANPHIMIVPKYILEPLDGPAGEGKLLQMEDVDGVGPFKPTKWIEGSIWEAERNETYFEKGLPYLDKYVMIELPDPASKIAAFRTKRIDMFSHFATTPSRDEAQALKQELGDQVTHQPVIATTAEGFQLHWKRKPLDDIRIREAIDLAYNRQQERDLLLKANLFSGPYHCGWGWVFTCQELESWPGHRADKTEDLKRAKELMRQAGYNPDQPSLVLNAACSTSTVSDDPCELLREDLAKIGIDMKITRLQTAAFRKQVADQVFDIHPWTRYLTAGDPEDYNGLHYLPTAVENRAQWENPRFVELWKQQRREFDQEKRGKLVR
ncbi:MAG: ABC transporter substrate-binding protein, partial [Chloroflexi bacterium]|nr:ABC transporter substrate-binding protein [Chloroflexota bacterium]